MGTRYLIALGSNVRHRRFGAPPAVLRQAVESLKDAGITVERASPVITTRPHGPSLRQYANAAAIVCSALHPPELLAALKRIEQQFGRRRGRRWGPRVLDLDIVLWQRGPWSSPGLTVPHVAFRHRAFVLRPAQAIADDWRDPMSGLTIRQLARRYTF